MRLCTLPGPRAPPGPADPWEMRNALVREPCGAELEAPCVRSAADSRGARAHRDHWGGTRSGADGARGIGVDWQARGPTLPEMRTTSSAAILSLALALLLAAGCGQRPSSDAGHTRAAQVQRQVRSETLSAARPQGQRKAQDQGAKGKKHSYLLPPEKVLPSSSAQAAPDQRLAIDIVGAVLQSGRYFSAVAEGDRLYCASLRGIDVFALEGPSAPRLLGATDTPGQAVGLLRTEGLTLVADDYAGITVLAGDPASGAETRQRLPTTGMVKSLARVGTAVAACHHSGGVVFYQLDDRGLLKEIARLDTEGRAFRLAVQGKLAALANGPGPLLLIDAGDPANPRVALRYSEVGFAVDCAWMGDLLLVADRRQGLLILRRERQGALTQVGRLAVEGKVRAVEVLAEDRAVVVSDLLATIVDLAHPAQPQVISRIRPRNEFRDAVSLGDRLVLLDGDHGPAIFSLADDKRPRCLGRFTRFRLLSDVKLDAGHAYCVAGADGFYTVAAGDDGSLKVEGHITEGLTRASAVELRGSTAFVTDYTGIKAIDVSRPSAPRIIGRLDLPGRTVALDRDDARGLLYVADWFEGVQIVDARNPRQMRLLGTQAIPAGWVVDVVAQDKTCYSCIIDYGLLVIDVQDPARPRIIGENRQIESPEGGEVQGDYLFVSDFNNALVVLDISRRDKPQVRTSVRTGAAKGMAIEKNRLWLANYFHGVKIFDISNPLQPLLLGALDTPGKTYAVATRGDAAVLADWHSLLRVRTRSPE